MSYAEWKYDPFIVLSFYAQEVWETFSHNLNSGTKEVKERIMSLVQWSIYLEDSSILVRLSVYICCGCQPNMENTLRLGGSKPWGRRWWWWWIHERDDENNGERMTQKEQKRDWLGMRERALNYGVKLRCCLQVLKYIFLVVGWGNGVVLKNEGGCGKICTYPVHHVCGMCVYKSVFAETEGGKSSASLAQ